MAAQLILALTLICRGSYRDAREFLRDLVGGHVSAGTVHNVHNVHGAAAELAGVINGVVDLSPIEVGLHDESFQGGQPVLAGVDAASTYCYLLEAVEHRDADTWGVHLLEASAQGLDPKFTVAAMCCTSSTRSKAWPTRWLASSRATRRAASSDRRRASTQPKTRPPRTTRVCPPG